MNASTTHEGIDDATISTWRSHFPILEREVNGKPLAYLDTAATAHRPASVIRAETEFYGKHNANVHRGIHTLSREATELFEAARKTIAEFIGAPDPQEVVFTRGATESINLVAQGWARKHLREGDVILVTEMEHHSNMVPWQLVAEQVGAVVKPIRVTDDGVLDLVALRSQLSDKVRVLAVAHASNVLGTINPLAEIAAMAHEVGAVLCVDGAQGLAHGEVDVRALGADFYAFSAHKVYGPTGAGGLWASMETLESMDPFMGGGEMIEDVSFAGSTWAKPPMRFEAGTLNIAGLIGFAEALRFVKEIGLDAIAAHERSLLDATIEGLSGIDGVTMHGPTTGPRSAIVPFLVEGAHAHDVGMVLDQHGVAVRTGRHCAYPLATRYGFPAITRASFGLYNTREEVDRLVGAVRECVGMFA